MARFQVVKVVFGSIEHFDIVDDETSIVWESDIADEYLADQICHIMNRVWRTARAPRNDLRARTEPSYIPGV